MIIQQRNIRWARYMACTRVNSKHFEWKIWNKKKVWNKQMQKKNIIFKWAFKKCGGGGGICGVDS